jgi:hypothetical protein
MPVGAPQYAVAQRSPSIKDGDGDGVIFDGTPQERPASYGEDRLAKLRRRRGEDSRGVSQAVTETEEFRQWFGDSKVVDSDGKPLVVYHGTGAVFNEFSKTGERLPSIGYGYYFSPNPDVASTYAVGQNPHVKPVYLRAERMLDWGALSDDDRTKIRTHLEAIVPDERLAGFGGIVKREFTREQDDEAEEFYRKKKDETKHLFHDRAKAHADFDKHKTTISWMEPGLGSATDSNLKSLAQEYDQNIARTLGYDSARNGEEIVVFDRRQIKSATGNNGQFSRESGDISKAVSASAIFTRAMEIKDGDGDGVVLDGTPQQRPVIQTPVHPRERRNAHRLRIDFYHNQPELKEHNEFDWESRPAPEDDAAWSERSDRIFAIHDIATRMFSDDAEGFSALPPEEQAARKSVLESVWFKCPIRMLLRITHNVGHTVHHENYDGVTAAAMRHRGASEEEINSALSTDKRVAGMWSYSPTSRENGTLHLGTGYGLPSGDRATKSAKSIYAHELGHVLDGKAEFSKQEDWKLAWEKEIKPGQLTPYATTNPSEGFAEYFESMIENPKDARKSYPQCWQFFSERFGI